MIYDLVDLLETSQDQHKSAYPHPLYQKVNQNLGRIRFLLDRVLNLSTAGRLGNDFLIQTKKISASEDDFRRLILKRLTK